jgi:ADP-heptose:LPS heptosyltransferase
VTADRIVVVRALPGLGEMLCAVPALRALRGTAPRAQIALIGLPSSSWLLERFPTYLNELIPFPGFPGAPEPPVDARKIVTFLAEAQERRFDLAIQLDGSGVASNAFAGLLGARATAGAHAPGLEPPDRDLFIPYPAREPEPVRLVRVIEHLGASPARGCDLELPPLPADADELAEALGGDTLEPDGYACLHPGASAPRGQWNAAAFAAVGDALAGQGLRVVLTGASSEAKMTAAVRDAMDHEPLDLAGVLSLGAAGALLRDAALLVVDDSGPSHLAAAVRTPSVVIFGPDADVRRWAPLDRDRHRALGGKGGDVTVDEVVTAAEELLSRRAQTAAT